MSPIRTVVQSSATLGRALRDRRRARGLTQSAAAEQAGIGQPTLSNIERGVTHPSLETLLPLLAVLELELVLQPREAAEDLARTWDRA
jgi:HTH-type transcriptional regulator/antitoxin HipB